MGAFDYDFNANGSLHEIDLPNGITASFRYNEIGEVIALEYRSASNPTFGFSATKEASGKTIAQASPGSHQALTQDQTWTSRAGG
ncbi:hypothetical protein G5V59_20185 [Nocardioides sp. W3-2-3]|uniref:hypothetical protein n=1 Tax=Nocardioides convexus TaxID=2712224 RepID=UPI00241831F6|nr:hypothetical protein [Nocardioides convexus]NHA01381.1 hypothetical protein [Nocardioides convexus]